ncbi:hypothetical protein NL676_033977 [Syzygium grande]|nr:hypothetical protein NL676_033977 [Syzygium grande]
MPFDCVLAEVWNGEFSRGLWRNSIDPDLGIARGRILRLCFGGSEGWRSSKKNGVGILETMLGKAAQSSFLDWTQEFQIHGIGERLKKSVSNGPGPNGPSSSSIRSKAEEQRSGVALQSEFNRRASKIGLGIHQTSQKLAKLVKYLQLLCNSPNEGGVSSDTASHSTTVVDDLKNRFMSATKWFIEVLTMRAENLKVHENRRRLFSSTTSEETANPFVRQCPLAARTATNASAAPPPPFANGSPPPPPSPSPSPSPSPLLPSKICILLQCCLLPASPNYFALTSYGPSICLEL